MKKIRYGLIGLLLLVGAVTTAEAEVSISIGLPRVSIGINLPMFPELVRVPGYPVYYAPRLSGNYFFYDGLYWVYQDDTWYASSWYNGPWEYVEPFDVPLFILRVPVRYYRLHPAYFRGWRANEPPRWGDHWGREWEHQRQGWERWDRRSAPTPAPLPVYQRQYSGSQYPRGEQQQTLHRREYRYEPRDAMVRQHAQKPAESKAARPAQREMRDEPERRSQQQPAAPASSRVQPSKRADEKVQRSTPARQEQRGPAREQRPQPVTAQPERQAPAAREQGQRSQPRAESQPASARQEQRGPAREQRQEPVTAQPERQAPAAQEQGQRSQPRRESRQPKRPRGQDQQKDEEERGRERTR